jgi:hypothetical protein
MPSRDIAKCTEDLQNKFLLFKEKCDLVGLKFVLTCTSREYLEQIALYAQGREKLQVVNHLRGNVGMPPINDKANSRAITWTLKSKHIVGDLREKSEAFDIALLDKSGKLHWDTNLDTNGDLKKDYLQVAEIAKSVGLIAGAFFRDVSGSSTPDYCHFEV